MLMVLAASNDTAKITSSQTGNRSLSVAASPLPVTIPIRAHMICTAAISGHVTRAVHSSVVPSCAPATEYVAMPDGSSSAAPVMMPGPSDFNTYCSQRVGEGVCKRRSGTVLSGNQKLQSASNPHEITQEPCIG